MFDGIVKMDISVSSMDLKSLQVILLPFVTSDQVPLRKNTAI
jgi:hypothetical protein